MQINVWNDLRAVKYSSINMDNDVYDKSGGQLLCHLVKCTGELLSSVLLLLRSFFKKNRLRLSYTCTHKSRAFAPSFGVTFARLFSQLFLGQRLVFYKVLTQLPLFSRFLSPCL